MTTHTSTAMHNATPEAEPLGVTPAAPLTRSGLAPGARKAKPSRKRKPAAVRRNKSHAAVQARTDTASNSAPGEHREASAANDQVTEPTTAQLAKAEKAEKESRRTLATLRAAGRHNEVSNLSRYFREMNDHEVLTPQQELEAARQIEKLELAYWQILMSHLPAFGVIAHVIRGHVDTPLPQLESMRRLARKAGAKRRLSKCQQTHWTELSEGLARALRAEDHDRLFVQDAHRAVSRLTGQHAGERDMLSIQFDLNDDFGCYLDRVKRAERAQQRAKNRFVENNLRLVVSIARRYNHGRMPLIDIIQEGNVGLLKGVERFDHTRGYRFSTYASWWIRHSINRALADKSRVVRVPVHMLDAYQRVARVTRAIEARTGRPPTPAEIEAETGVNQDKQEQLQKTAPLTPYSLNRSVGDDDSRQFIDFLASEDTPSPLEDLESKKWRCEVKQLLKDLTPMEARILRWRFGLDDHDELTLKQIGDKYNLSRERIRQLQEQALGKIRRQLAE